MYIIKPCIVSVLVVRRKFALLRAISVPILRLDSYGLGRLVAVRSIRISKKTNGRYTM